MADDLKLVLRITGDGTAARAEVASLTGEVRKAAAATGELGSRSDRTASAVGNLAAAEVRAGQNAVAMARNNAMAAGSVGNLAAQFNDIGVMLAAGQSPLQLAIQQGTLIGQVFGTAGAAGRVQMLKAALMSIVSPVKLLTIGLIAAGATMFQWLFSAGEEAKTLDDAIGDLGSSMDKVRAAGKVTAADLKKEFGTVTPEVIRLNEEVQKLANVQAVLDLRAAFAALKGEVEGAWLSTDINQAAALLNVNSVVQNGPRALAVNPMVAGFQSTLAELNGAQGLPAQLALVEQLKDQFLTAAGGMSKLNLEQAAYLDNILATERALRAMIAAQAKVPEQSRFAGTDDAIEVLVAQKQAEAAARALNTQLQQEAGLRQIINAFGEDSVIVANARRAAEREAFVVMADGMSVSRAMKDELIASYDAANRLAGSDLVSVIGGWAAAAATLAGNMWSAATGAEAIRRFNQQSEAGSKTYSGRGGDPRTSNSQGYGEFVYTGPSLDAFNVPIATGGGGGGGSVAAERDAVEELITSLADELAILREMDPVKAEMLRHREDLAGATEEERKEVEALIRAQEQEKALKETMEFLGQTSLDALKGIVQGGDEAVNSIKRLGQALLDAAIQAMWLGSGPLAGLLGTTGSSALSLLFPTVPGHADGGMAGEDPGLAFALPSMRDARGRRLPPLRRAGLQTGPGGARDDLMHVRVSAGEFIVNGRSTARYRPLLERINAGADIPGFAQGGGVGLAALGQTGGPGGDINLHVHLEGAKGDKAIEEMIVKSIGVGLQEYDRTALPGRVKTIVRQGGRVVG